METNHITFTLASIMLCSQAVVVITLLLQYHITFTLASIMLCSQAVVVIGQQWPTTLLCYPLMS